jgi:methyl-accepting chemotaxis protein
MHRLYWFTVGIIVGVFAYRYFREQGGEIPGFESLGEGSRRLTERGREFADSGKQFVESGRQLASESRQFAQTAADTAQTRGREVVDTVKAQASKMTDARQREDVKQDYETAPG